MHNVKICPICGSKKIYVTDTRQNFDRLERKRECRECGYYYNTVEMLLEDYIKWEKPVYKAIKITDRIKKLDELDAILARYYRYKG